MPRQLYPKPTHVNRSVVRAQENLNERPFHVLYTDPSGQMEPEWGHYNTELEVKSAAWYRCRLLGFQPEAVLYTRDEFQQLATKSLGT